eukprot:symbB.v1.2.022572.t3/scaffold1978.1/size96278/1
MYLFGGWTGSLLNDLHFINGEAKSGKRMVSAYEPQPPLQLPQPPLRLHRHLPPPQALLARQALQVPQARQVQLLPAVAQVPLLLRHRHLPPPQALLARQAQAPLLLRHRHLPPPQALLARQALQVPQARQVQLPPAVAQVSPRVPNHREYPCSTSMSCAEHRIFASFRHRHLPPPQALLARQAQAPLLLRHRHLPPPQALLARQAQVPQARQVQLLPAVAQVPLLLRADLPPVLPERRCPRLEPCLASLKRRHKPCYATSNPATSRYTATSAAS